MTLLAIYSSPTTPGSASWAEDVTSAIRLGSITGLSGEARLGATGIGNVVLDDPTSTLGHLSDGIVGLKQFHFLEFDAPIGNQRLWTGYVGSRTYRRGVNDSLRTGAARKIDVTLIDLNDFLGFRVFAPTEDDPTSDFVRPAETDLERVAALLTDVDFLSTTLFDVGYIPATGGVDMDANDYTGSRPADVLNDCAQASGRNFFVLYDEATNRYALWYDDWRTDGSSTRTYDSPLRLTNVLSEVDGSVTFAAEEPQETLDPSRLISAVRGTGSGVKGYETKPLTANTYAWRDGAPLSSFVKTQATMDALLLRLLNDNDTEDPTIRCSVQLPNAKVTSIHEGMRLQVHFTHLPLVADEFTWTRVLSRNIRVDVETQQYYWLDLELSPIPPIPCVDFELTPTDAGYYGNLYDYWGLPAELATDPDGVTYYSNATIPLEPTPGWVGNWGFYVLGVADVGSPSGTYDTAWAGAGNSAFGMFVGVGTVTAHMRYGYEQDPSNPGSAFVDVTILMFDGIHWVTESEDLDILVPEEGIDIDVVLPDDEHCIHVVQVEFGRGGEPGSGYRNVGFGGWTWAPV